MGVFSGLLDLIFPPRCVFCRRFLKKGEGPVCRDCRENLPYFRGVAISVTGDFFDECVAPLMYKDDVRKSLLRFKFKGETGYAGCYGHILAECIKNNLNGKYDVITWVPISRERKNRRGYDQSMLLAYAAAVELEDAALETLEKHVDARPQSEIKSSKAERKANISGAFRVCDREFVEGKRILLIDDIMTTGSTLSECARELLMAGAESVVCAVLARKERV